MRMLRFLHSISFSIGLSLLLCGAVVLLTEKIVVYPNEHSLPILQLCKIEEAGFQDAEQDSRTSRDAGHHTVGYSRWRNARRWRIDLPAGRQNDVAKCCVTDPDYGCTASCPAIAFSRMTSASSVPMSTFDSSRTACRNVTKPGRVSNAGPESFVTV